MTVCTISSKVHDIQNDYFLCRNQNQYYFSTKTLNCKTIAYLNLSSWWFEYSAEERQSFQTQVINMKIELFAKNV